jgi:hypothetical protein
MHKSIYHIKPLSSALFRLFRISPTSSLCSSTKKRKQRKKLYRSGLRHVQPVLQRQKFSKLSSYWLCTANILGHWIFRAHPGYGKQPPPPPPPYGTPIGPNGMPEPVTLMPTQAKFWKLPFIVVTFYSKYTMALTFQSAPRHWSFRGRWTGVTWVWKVEKAHLQLPYVVNILGHWLLRMEQVLPRSEKSQL